MTRSVKFMNGPRPYLSFFCSACVLCIAIVSERTFDADIYFVEIVLCIFYVTLQYSLPT